MKHIRKILSVITALALVLSMSGCYWEGKTKLHSELLLLNALKQKYDESFVIRQIWQRSGSGHPLLAYCSPKNNNDLVFEAEYNKIGNDYVLSDMYIQSIVRLEMKNQIDTVLAQYYDNFSSEIYVWGLEEEFDTGITDADTVTIASYTEALPNSNQTYIWIAIDRNEVNDIYEIDCFSEILAEATENFHYTTAAIDLYIVSNDIVEQSNDKINSDYDIMNILTILSSGNCKIDDDNYYIMHGYRYLGSANGLDYVRTVNKEDSYAIDN